ncbi:MAG: phytase [Planctomycetes bacterium]|nr:phytase [Planctomycetota bacterium]
MLTIRRWCLWTVAVTVLSLPQVSAAQTAQATVATRSMGKADGVAICVNPGDPARSTIIGADPQKGIGSFDLEGNILHVVHFSKGGGAGVDVRHGFPLGGERITLILAGNSEINTLRFFKFNPNTRLLGEVTGTRAQLGIHVYGCCLYHSAETGTFYAVVTSREGFIEQWELYDDGRGRINANRVRQINIMEGQDSDPSLNPKIEACVADDELDRLYISQEKECLIWQYGAEPDSDVERRLVDTSRIRDGDNTEGLAIYATGPGTGYLLVSIQGSWKYKVYTREGNNTYLGSFDVRTADGRRGVESHDCIAVTPTSLGTEFPHGLFVTQNADPSGDHYQLVSWESIADLLQLKKVH